MTATGDSPVILVVDDSPADRLLTTKAFQRALLKNPVIELENGEELMNYLLRRGRFGNREITPRPMLILLDLNMPRMNGMEALAQIKANPELRSIPVIMLTTSRAEEDIIRSYELGVSSFITKPVDFGEFLEAIRKLGQYWLQLVTLPAE